MVFLMSFSVRVTRTQSMSRYILLIYLLAGATLGAGK